MFVFKFHAVTSNCAIADKIVHILLTVIGTHTKRIMNVITGQKVRIYALIAHIHITPPQKREKNKNYYDLSVERSMFNVVERTKELICGL